MTIMTSSLVCSRLAPSVDTVSPNRSSCFFKPRNRTHTSWNIQPEELKHLHPVRHKRAVIGPQNHSVPNNQGQNETTSTPASHCIIQLSISSLLPSSPDD
eukprot:m.695451 g.695451  ORF g.695451 m.695451 type:complete len:100 (+) comp58668_c0_seq62:885-1184(+)